MFHKTKKYARNGFILHFKYMYYYKNTHIFIKKKLLIQARYNLISIISYTI